MNLRAYLEAVAVILGSTAAVSSVAVAIAPSEYFLTVLFTCCIVVGLIVLFWVLNRISVLERRLGRVIDTMFESARMLHPDKLGEMQEMLRRIFD